MFGFFRRHRARSKKYVARLAEMERSLASVREAEELEEARQQTRELEATLERLEAELKEREATAQQALLSLVEAHRRVQERVLATVEQQEETKTVREEQGADLELVLEEMRTLQDGFASGLHDLVHRYREALHELSTAHRSVRNTSRRTGG